MGSSETSLFPRIASNRLMIRDLALPSRSLAYASSIGHSQRFQLSPPRPSPPSISLLIHPLAMDGPSFDKSGIPQLTVVDYVLKLGYVWEGGVEHYPTAITVFTMTAELFHHFATLVCCKDARFD